MSDDLEQIIADSVNDSYHSESESDAPVEEVVSDTPVEASSELVEATGETTEGEVAAGDENASSAVPSPAAAAAAPVEPQDEFSKLAGMPQIGPSGRENRIPYSRVKAITEKSNRQLAETALGRALTKDEKPAEVLKTFAAQIPEMTAKVTEYEQRLTTVGQFEQVMETDPEKFLGMLEQLPAYKDFFAFVQQAVDAQTGAAGAVPAQPPAPVVLPSAEMPEPDQRLEDGSMVYSMEGLKALLEWNANQTETRVTSKYEQSLQKLEEKYKPLKTDWEEQRRIQATLPTIRKQIEEAKTWPLFEDSEQEILQILQKDKQISLEGAYRQVVFPKLIADRNKTRQDVINEVRKAPTASAVPARAATKPVAVNAGPRRLEDIIAEQVESLKR